MTSAFSWQTPLPFFILYSEAKFACYSRYLLTSYFCIPVPYDEKDIFLVLVLEGLVGLFNFIFFSISGWGIDLDYCDIEWFAWKGIEIILLYWEKEMATHSSILAWKIPWTEEPGGLYSTG